mgnify:CR=1 FL=1
MAENESLRDDLVELEQIVQELIETLHNQARELDLFVTRVEQQTTLRDFPKGLSVVASQLSQLQYRVHKLTSQGAPQMQVQG